MESAANKCLNCKKPSPATLCAACQETMKKSMESAPKNLFPYILPKGTPAPPPGLVVPQPTKPLVLEVRPRCLADKAPNQRCAKPSTLFFCEEHGTQWIQEKRQLEELVQEQRDQLGNMEANNHSLAMKKAEEIKELHADLIMLEKRCKEQSVKLTHCINNHSDRATEELKAQLTAAEKCDECDKHTPELLRFCLDCYPTYLKDDLADDPYLREDVLEPYLKKKDEKIQALERQVEVYLEYQDIWMRERRSLWLELVETREKLKKHQKQRKGKRELADLQEGVRSIWGQEGKRPKRN